MKRLLIVLFGLMLLSSCVEPIRESDATRFQNPGTVPFSRAIHFEYKNHEYIKFDENAGKSSVGGVVHNPECKYCLKDTIK